MCVCGYLSMRSSVQASAGVAQLYLRCCSSRLFLCGRSGSASVQMCVCRTVCRAARGRASAPDRTAGCRDSTSTRDTPLHQHAARSGNRSRVSLRALLPADTGTLWVCF